jgi:hypothetical protein
MTNDTTTQLRRYVLVEGKLDAFLPWWQEKLVPARRAYGFTVEFGYAIPETDEFVWAVSLPGDAEHFAEVEAAYIAGPERAAAFDGVDPWTTSQTITLVSRVL